MHACLHACWNCGASCSAGLSVRTEKSFDFWPSGTSANPSAARPRLSSSRMELRSFDGRRLRLPTHARVGKWLGCRASIRTQQPWGVCPHCQTKTFGLIVRLRKRNTRDLDTPLFNRLIRQGGVDRLPDQSRTRSGTAFGRPSAIKLVQHAIQRARRNARVNGGADLNCNSGARLLR